MSNVLAFRSQVEFDELVCCTCGVVYFVPQLFVSNRRKNHDNFYCPSGHSQHFPGKSNEEKLSEELEAERKRKETALMRANDAQARAERAETEARNARADQKRARTMMANQRKRIQAGVCPCCNRTFQNLARHMATKHSEKDHA